MKHIHVTPECGSQIVLSVRLGSRIRSGDLVHCILAGSPQEEVGAKSIHGLKRAARAEQGGVDHPVFMAISH